LKTRKYIGEACVNTLGHMGEYTKYMERERERLGKKERNRG